MIILICLLSIVLISVAINKKAKTLRVAIAGAQDSGQSSSLPIHYSYCFAVWSTVLLLAIFMLNIDQTSKLLVLLLSLIALYFIADHFVESIFDAKGHLENILRRLMMITALIGIAITIAITLSILFESIRFFKMVNFFDFIFGLKWNPQMAMHENQAVTNSSFGVVPVLLGTLLITFVAMIIAIPLGIMSAVYLYFYTNSKVRDFFKPILEILAGIPTVVYGYFAIVAVAPFFKGGFEFLGVNIAAESALGAGFVMGIMIIPFVSSLVDDAINSVPSALKDGSLALGSTKSEMIKNVVIPYAMPSITGAIILAFSRAIGETMIVTMAAGLVANLTFNPLDSVTTATAQIVTLLVGDQEFDSPKTLAAFAIALVLFTTTLIFNFVALKVIKKYKRR